MNATIDPPTERSCERCGRQDVWDPDRESWVIVEEEGRRLAGDPQCLHEWDINGSYNPITGDT